MAGSDKRIEYIVISPFFPTPEKYYGPFIYDLVCALRKHSHYNVTVFKPVSWNEKCEDYVYDGIPVHCFRTFDLPSYIFNGIMNPINVLSFKRKLKKAGIKYSNIIAAHGHTVNSGAYCNFLKCRNNAIVSILHHHDPDPFKILHGKFCENSLNLRIRAWLSSHIISKMDWNVSVSKKVQENLLAFPEAGSREGYAPYIKQLRKLSKNKFPALDKTKCCVLYNGVNGNLFYPKISSAKTKSTGIFTVGCNANYVDWKRHEILIDAIKILVDKSIGIELRLLGTNPRAEFERIKEYIHKLGLDNHVKYIPPCDHKKTIDFYHSLDLFVLPSVFEGFGCVFTEAYACGVPFMSCKGQAIEEIVRDEDHSKFFSKEDDALALSVNIERFMENRFEENLCEPIFFDELIPRFLNNVNL